MTIKIELLCEELTEAGLDYYWAQSEDGETLNIRFLAENGTKRLPTPEEQVVIDAVLEAHDPEALTAGEQLRETILSLASSAEGVLLTNLTDNQIRALLACMLWKVGGVSYTARVNPLSDWL